MTITREVTWGEGLMVETSKVPGGLNALVTGLRREFGDLIGSRNTFKKLYEVQDPSVLSQRDQYRAWLLLAALGQDPQEWGLSVTVVPPAVALDGLFEKLQAARAAAAAENTGTSDQKVRGSNPFGCTKTEIVRLPARGRRRRDFVSPHPVFASVVAA